jgi:glucose/arabinose dehydrogenase
MYNEELRLTRQPALLLLPYHLSDAGGTLWGVENGADNLYRADVGGDVHNENPGEELNRLDQPGKFYGYPRCWSEHTLPAKHAQGKRAQWAWPSFMPATTDAWCRDPQNVVPPALVMPAHTAPLGLAFFGASEAHQPNRTPAQTPCDGADDGAFPCTWLGDAFVGMHGSWNRQPPAGYGVLRVPFNGTTNGATNPTGEVATFLAHGGKARSTVAAGAVWPGGRGVALRPVDVRFDLKV